MDANLILKVSLLKKHTTKSFVKNKYKNKNIKTFHKRFSSLHNTSKDADVWNWEVHFIVMVCLVQQGNMITLCVHKNAMKYPRSD